MTRIVPYKDKVVDFVLIRENTGHWKPVFSHVLCSDSRNLLLNILSGNLLNMKISINITSLSDDNGGVLRSI